MSQGSQKQYIFQIGLLAAFGAFVLIGVFVLATFEQKKQTTVFAPIEIWGPPITTEGIQATLKGLKTENESFLKVSYVQKNPATMYNDILEAVATGQGPDLIIIDQSKILTLKNKLAPISFETLPLSTYRSTYIDGAEIFVLDGAIYAYPFFVDPLVMYYNRDLFVNAGIAQVPTNWDTFVELVPRLSTIVRGADLTQAAVPFGEYDNVLHAKEILATLLMQAGASIVYDSSGEDSRDKKLFKTDLGSGDNANRMELALQFYTSFSNPVKTVYSWNKTFDRSLEAFTANDVAMYAGFLSEEGLLTDLNDSLNYGISVWPQSNNSHTSVTFGDFYGIAVMRTSQYPRLALYVAQTFALPQHASIIAETTGLPSARRDGVTYNDEGDPYANVKVQSAIIARGWLEPSPESEVNEIFRNAVQNIVAGTITPRAGINQIKNDIDVLLNQYNI
jgi:ABC-type glycerol-3-phosphate transport system substrate-binding protein